MATIGPQSAETAPLQSSRPLNFTNARLLILQRCVGTLAHELGNVTSPLALIADVLDAGRPQQVAAAAGTVRLVATSLSRATTICRFLRGNADPGALSPSTIPDAGAWWTLCAPFVEDMLPGPAHVRATIDPVALPMLQYDALTWASIAIARFAGETRPTLTALTLRADRIAADNTLLLRMIADAPRAALLPSRAKQLLQLASWELRRVGGRVLIGDRDAAFECQMRVPLPASAQADAIN